MELTLHASPDAPPEFPYEEKAARHALGWTEDEMRAIRKAHLTPREITLHKKRLWLTAAGVDKLFAAAGQPAPKKTPPATGGLNPGDVSGAAEKNAAPEVETLIVVRTDLANQHLLLACKPTDNPDRPARPLRVRVSDTSNFTRRMEIPAVLVAGYTDLYDLARAVPRQKGKW